MMQQDENKPVQNQWHAVEYSVDEKSTLIISTVAPFDGNPVLISTSSGIMEAVWEPASRASSYDGPSGTWWDKGFCWNTAIGDIELDEAHQWMHLPEEENKRPDTLPNDEQPRLILTEDQGWMEAWYDKEFQVWQALDAFIQVATPQVKTWKDLPSFVVNSHTPSQHNGDIEEAEIVTPTQATVESLGAVPQEPTESMPFRWWDRPIRSFEIDDLHAFLQKARATIDAGKAFSIGKHQIAYFRKGNAVYEDESHVHEATQTGLYLRMPRNTIREDGTQGFAWGYVGEKDDLNDLVTELAKPFLKSSAQAKSDHRTEQVFDPKC